MKLKRALNIKCSFAVKCYKQEVECFIYRTNYCSYFLKYPISVYAYFVLLILFEIINGKRIIKMIKNATSANPHKSVLTNTPDVISQIGESHPEHLFIDIFVKVNSEIISVLKLLLDKNLNNGFPAKLKESLIPLFAAQMKLPIDDEQTIYKLDFYLSGTISVLSRWVTSDNPMPPEKYALLVKQIVEGMHKSELFPI